MGLRGYSLQKRSFPLAGSMLALYGIGMSPSKPLIAQGYEDAKRGHTACVYGTEKAMKLWNKGYDKAEKDGVAQFTRFSQLKRKKK
jgi:hypothetical protein